MKLMKLFLLLSICGILLPAAATARDFGWTEGFNIEARADPDGFHTRMEARFKIGDVAVRAVLSNMEEPADAYIVCRIGEMSGYPVEYVMDKYQSGKGWGSLAKSLGIKPGSREFHALKNGQDLYGSAVHLSVNTKGKSGKRNSGKGGKQRS